MKFFSFSNYKLLLILPIVFISSSVIAQEARIVLPDSPLELKVGEKKPLEISVLDENNEPIEGGGLSIFAVEIIGFVPSSGILADSLGNLHAQVPGEYNLMIYWYHQEKRLFTKDKLHTFVVNDEPGEISINDFKGNLNVGDTKLIQVSLIDKSGFEIMEPNLKFQSSKNGIVNIDSYGNISALKNGKATIIISSGSVSIEKDIMVSPNPVNNLMLQANINEARTGDVITFDTNAYDKKGQKLKDININYAVSQPGNSVPSALIDERGKFVAEKPGSYTIMAAAGDKVASKTISIEPRNMQRDIKVLDQGMVNKKRTTDIWVWEGSDGRDYAVTGTHAADGMAYFWDVTNPSEVKLVDSIAVDARSVNDVKVSEDGKVCVISREGASNRKNGIVILDVENPRDVKIHSIFTNQLTGGVHNLFVYDNHVYALSNGQRYEIVNIEDPKNPKRVGHFEIENPARSIHDVWVHNGIAYSSNWNDGVIMVDVGNGIAGGSPSNPVEIARARTEGNANHTAFPYYNKTMEKEIVIAGDEIFPTEFDLENVVIPRGYLHFMDMTDPENPKEIARYKVPEAGAHNFWVVDDILYIAYYNGGLRVVDVSGELMGDLYNQGREIASFLPLHPEGYIPNNAMSFGVMPHKGTIFFSDMNTGLWSVKVSPNLPEETMINTK